MRDRNTTTPRRPAGWRATRAAVVLTLVVAFAACGGSDPDAATTTTTSATTTTAPASTTTVAATSTTTVADTAPPSGYGGGGEGDAVEAANEDLATGVWQATPESLTRMFEMFFEDIPSASLGGAVEGRLVLHFDGVETATLDYIDVIVPLEVEGVVIPVGVDGGGRLGYTVEPGVIVFGDRTTLDLTFQVFGEPMTFDQDDLPTGSVEVSYELDGDTLLLVPLDDAAPLPTDWVRQPDE